MFAGSFSAGCQGVVEANVATDPHAGASDPVHAAGLPDVDVIDAAARRTADESMAGMRGRDADDPDAHDHIRFLRAVQQPA